MRDKWGIIYTKFWVFISPLLKPRWRADWTSDREPFGASDLKDILRFSHPPEFSSSRGLHVKCFIWKSHKLMNNWKFLQKALNMLTYSRCEYLKSCIFRLQLMSNRKVWHTDKGRQWRRTCFEILNFIRIGKEENAVWQN